MVKWWAVALASAVILAGCAGDAGTQSNEQDDEDTSFEDLDVKATSTTGVIRGVVVDERVVPIPDAEISVTGADTNRSAVSDEQGRFAFSDLQPGTYFLRATSLLHSEAQTSVEVVAGVDEPAVTKVLLQRKFAQEPFVEAYSHDGFIQCNQAGAVYATAPCVTDVTGLIYSYTGIVPPGCTQAGCAPQLRTIQQENRGFTVALGPGWQTLVWEMSWEEASPTFEQMGVTVSYNVTERCACHNYGSYGSTSPLRMQIDLGVDFEPSNAVEPELIDPNGLPALYYFVGVRDGPALAVNQQFQLFSHFFYYGVPPEGWSFINGDPLPF